MSPFEPRIWYLAHGRTLDLGPKGHLMAIINVTPDSFSDGGEYVTQSQAMAQGMRCLAEGASILDIGGESTRPNAVPVSEPEEWSRVLPVIEALAQNTNAILSVDTYRASTARLAIEAGAHIINNVDGLQGDPLMATVAAQSGAGICIMHTGRNRQRLDDVIADQVAFLNKSLAIAQKAGVKPGQIMLDPGFGFGKETTEENFELMARFSELHDLGKPFMVGTSRKRFLGSATDREPSARGVATAATTAVLRRMGASIFRVHDVDFNRDALRVIDAMLETEWKAAAREPGA